MKLRRRKYLFENELLIESDFTKKWSDGVKKWWKQWVKKADSIPKMPHRKLRKHINAGENRLHRIKDDMEYKKGTMAFPGSLSQSSREKNLEIWKGTMNPVVDFAYIFDDAFEAFNKAKYELHYGTIDLVPGHIKKIDSIVSGKLFRRINKFIADINNPDVNRYGAPANLGKEGESELSIGRAKVIFDTGDRDLHGQARLRSHIIAPYDTHDYVVELQKAKALLDKAGLGKAWYGDFFIQPSVKAKEYTNPRTGGKFKEGAHWAWKDHVVLFGKPREGLHETIVHELGHRWYYKIMTKGERARFDSYFGDVQSVSEYGSSQSREDFAEVFTWYVLGRKLTRDQRERFKQFALKGGKIRRNEDREYRNDVDQSKLRQRNYLVESAPKKATRSVVANLKRSDRLLVYHGTYNEEFKTMANGIDALRVRSRSYNQGRHKGMFIAPDMKTARGFGHTVLAMSLPVRSMHAPIGYSGNIDTKIQDKDWEDRYPKSFRPSLSYSLLDYNTEPQAIYRGFVRPKDIIGVYDFAPGSSDHSGKMTLREAMKKYKIEDLKVDLTNPHFSISDFVKMTGFSEKRMKDAVIRHSPKDYTAIRDLLAHGGFGEYQYGQKALDNLSKEMARKWIK